jgi:hypothetical protein
MHIVSNRHPKNIFFKLPGKTSYLFVHRVMDPVKKPKFREFFLNRGVGWFFSLTISPWVPDTLPRMIMILHPEDSGNLK